MDWAPIIAIIGTLFTGVSTGMAMLWRWGAQQAEARAVRAEMQVDKLIPAMEKLGVSIERQGETLKDQNELVRSIINRLPMPSGDR